MSIPTVTDTGSTVTIYPPNVAQPAALPPSSPKGSSTTSTIQSAPQDDSHLYNVQTAVNLEASSDEDSGFEEPVAAKPLPIPPAKQPAKDIDEEGPLLNHRRSAEPEEIKPLEEIEPEPLQPSQPPQSRRSLEPEIKEKSKAAEDSATASKKIGIIAGTISGFLIVTVGAVLGVQYRNQIRNGTIKFFQETVPAVWTRFATWVKSIFQKV